MRIVPLIVSLLLVAACAKSPQQSSVQETAVDVTDQPQDKFQQAQSDQESVVGITGQTYNGFQQDRADLRDTYLIEKQDIQASSGKAGTAAHRVFTRIDFVGMSKADVLRLLGDPETISDYGMKIAEGADAPLVYLFDSGFGGNQWTILFQDAVVTKVEHVGLE